jgi:hypothetical protein
LPSPLLVAERSSSLPPRLPLVLISTAKGHGQIACGAQMKTTAPGTWNRRSQHPHFLTWRERDRDWLTIRLIGEDIAKENGDLSRSRRPTLC